MGHDIHPISNHNLKTDDFRNFALTLSNKLKLNVQYGYWGLREYFEQLETEGDDDFCVIDKIIINPNEKVYWLIEEGYQQKQLYRKLGDKIFKKDKLGLRINKNYVIHPHFTFEYDSDYDDKNDKDEMEYMYFSKEHFMNNFVDWNPRWWGFCRCFIEDFETYGKEMIANYRKELLPYLKLFGGDKTYFLDDQSKVMDGIGGGEEYTMGWHQLEQHVAKKSGKLMLNISEFMRCEDYRKLFISYGEYPLSFVDDFSDIN